MADTPPAPKVRNRRTQALNRRETIWQIALPLALVIVAALTMMFWVASPSGVDRRSVFADVSLIFLILPVMVWGLALLALMGALGWGLWYALRELPFLLKRAQDLAAIVAQRTKSSTATVAQGFMSAEAVLAAAQKTYADIRSIFGLGR